MVEPAEPIVSVDFIERFHARGMRRLHSLDVQFTGKRRVFRRDIWAAKDGRILVRFRCPTESDYDETLVIIGLTLRDLTKADLEAIGTESADDWPPWVPDCVRDRWDLWFTSVD